MHQFLTKTRKIGGSLVATIPKEVVDLQQIKENEYVEIKLKNAEKTALVSQEACNLHS